MLKPLTSVLFAACALNAASALAYDRASEAEQNLRELMGESYVAPLTESDSDFAAMRDRLIFGDLMEGVKLPPERAALVSLAAIAAAGAPDYARPWVKRALKSGATPVEIKEAVYQVAPYAGLPKAEAVLNVVNAVFKEEGIALPVKSTATVTEEDRFEKGKAFQVATYGERIRKMHETASEDERFLNVYLLSSFCFGDIYTRTALSLKDRELLTCSVIALIGGAEAQLTSHVRASFDTGNSKRDLVDAIALSLPYMGFPRSLNALAVVKKVEAERKAP